MNLPLSLLCLLIAFVLFLVEGFLGRSLHPVAIGFAVLALGLILA